ncbi:formiminoglutamate deiminase [Nocardioides daedukensis]|uniref:Formiminoglutamate deiminase n=1 Tax=Nocardioides daedukensis TaxID=634462 RepID=A0A7Y9S3Q9_9ACTN|nr:formimidoylglutamate deiminase [Nocardioides daedukensis]NYG59154.1 formiminoglutamate deiminase [Nocardioides daedukensis]
MTTYLLEHALIGDRVERDVLISVVNGRFARAKSPGTRQDWRFPGKILPGKHQSHPVPGDSVEAPTRIRGLAIPGIANCHSHAFHRALRGHTQAERGSFWSWRERMYAVAQRLTPETYYDLALATYTEMLCAGITSVGEFHYLHHQADGTPYANPNEMGEALIRAAQDAGIRIALLDTCYLSAGINPDGTHRPPEGVQARFSDGTADAWAERVATLGQQLPTRGGRDGSLVLGAAIHSVRAVPRNQISTVVQANKGKPLHVHLSEQVAENEQCLAAHGRTPTELLDELGALGPETSAVHATHLSDHDIALLGASRTHSCFCPTTERDLADGIGPSRALHDHGSPLTLGSDSHAIIDPFEEMRAIELNERLASQIRGHWSATELLTAATAHGQASIGFDDAGRIEAGQRADLVVIDLGSSRTAGTGDGAESVVFAATGADVTHVMVDGTLHNITERRDGLGHRLRKAIERL